MANYIHVLFRHVYQHNKNIVQIRPIQPTKLQNSHYFMNTPSIYFLLLQASEVIQQELAKKETVRLWCLLGDATDDTSCYEKAWELSGHKSGQTQRHWGMYYFSKRKVIVFLFKQGRYNNNNSRL